MKTSIPGSLSLLLAVLAVCGCTTVHPASKPQTWEYKRVAHGGTLSDDELQQLGRDGWILSGFSETESAAGPWVEAVFRRPARR